MGQKLRLFVSRSVVMVPHTWMTAMGRGEDSHDQAEVIAIARFKNDAGRMLENAGAHPSTVRDLRLATLPLPSAVQSLNDARVFSMDTPGLYAWHRFQDGAVVIRITGQEIKPVVRWVYVRKLGTRSNLALQRLPESQPAAGGESQ